MLLYIKHTLNVLSRKCPELLIARIVNFDHLLSRIDMDIGRVGVA